MQNIYFFNLSNIPWVPYAYGALRAYCEGDTRYNYRWHEPFFMIDTPESFLPLLENPSVVCFSMYLWNEKIHNRIAQLIRQRFPEALVVFGGPSVPNNKTIESYDYAAQIVVHGEGEKAFSEILYRWQNDLSLADIPNTSLKKSTISPYTFNGYQKDPVVCLESPYLKGYFDQILDKKVYKGIEIVALWEKERGCPYKCSFCDWPWTGTKVRYRGREDIFKEIDYFSRHKLTDIYMCDANFGMWKEDIEIARELARVKIQTGYPKTLIYSTAKRSDENVVAMSKILAEADMIWGTTLSVQSLNTETLKSIKRVNITPTRFKEFTDDNAINRIGVYSEVILGLPLETRSTFIEGIGKILESGNHEDLRLFEFFFLPNAPVNNQADIEKYGLVVRRKPLNLLSERNLSEEAVDIVVGTNTMPFDEWVFCYLYGELIQSLHNGGYLRYLSIYLHKELQMGIGVFYENFIQHFLRRPETHLGKVFFKLHAQLENFGNSDVIPTVHKIIANPQMKKELEKYGPKRQGWFPYQYAWLMLSEDMESVFAEIKSYFSQFNINQNLLEDLIQFQFEMMLTPEYDARRGKQREFNYDWKRYFFDNQSLVEQRTSYQFNDQKTGPGRRFSLVFENLPQFARAAVGDAYPFSKLRHFCHQPENINYVSFVAW